MVALDGYGNPGAQFESAVFHLYYSPCFCGSIMNYCCCRKARFNILRLQIVGLEGWSWQVRVRGVLLKSQT